MKKAFKKIVSIAPMILLSMSLFAGNYEGKIEELWVSDGVRENKGWIKLNSAMDDPACSSPDWFVVDLTDDTMKLALAFVLSAHIAGREVRLSGTGTCMESWEWLKFIVVK